MKTASWVLLAIAGALILLGGAASAYVAYGGVQDNLLPNGPSADALDAIHPGLGTAIRGRRATAAGFATAYGVLFLYVALVPYRRGDVWSWWALLAGAIALAMVIVARVAVLGVTTGAGTGVLQLAVVVVGLLLDVGRLKSSAAPAA
jgi:hypothetical protein